MLRMSRRATRLTELARIQDRRVNRRAYVRAGRRGGAEAAALRRARP